MVRNLLLLLIVAVTVGPVKAEDLSLIASRNLAGDASRILGIGELAASLKAGGTSTLLVDLGGALSPAEASFTHRRQGSLTVDLMNKSGYAAWFLGGRDLGWSNRLTRFLRRTDFPVLAANLHRPETGRHLFQVQPYTIVRVMSKRIGLIGLSDSNSDVLTSDPVSAAAYYTSLIADRTDIILVVNASGAESDRRIADVEGVDLVIGVGAQSDVLQTENGWIVTTDEYAGLWGIDLTLEDGAIVSAATNAMDVPPVGIGKVNQAFVGWTAQMEAEPVSLGTVIGRSEGGFSQGLTSPLGYFISDLMRGAEETDGALVRTIHFPEDFVTGDITVYDLFRAYPLPYTVGVVSIKGDELLQLLDLADGEIMYYPSGVSVVYGTAPDGLVESSLAGKPIDPRVDYTIAIETGGTLDPVFSGKSVRDTGLLIRDLLGSHIRTTETVKGVVDGRIQRR
jgi:2',3'-cyclic-nucleotide 2'-phosphodiesterase (5'-nucleotidase family)